jgi:hypothetical protein
LRCLRHEIHVLRPKSGPKSDIRSSSAEILSPSQRCTAPSQGAQGMLPGSHLEVSLFQEDSENSGAKWTIILYDHSR